MDISIFMESFKENLLRLFGDNLLFLGLQGSYGRGEAKETSDIDPVIVLWQCGKDELLRYRAYIDTLPEKDILCGFVSSIDELRAWERADRTQLILDTKPVYRDLAELCPQITRMISEELYSRELVQYTMLPLTTYFMLETGRFYRSTIRAQDSR